MAFRVDLGKLRPARRMSDGRVIVDAHISRIGIQEYELPDGSIRRELRTKAEVHDADSLASFEQVPVTRLHPPNGVTADNARVHMVGASGERVIPDEDHVRTQLMVADKATIQDMDRGIVGVSCGYYCDLVHEPGVDPVFGEYDSIQTNIRGNHIAVAVPNPRAGKTARVRMDDVRETARAMHMDGDVGVCWDMTSSSAGASNQPSRKSMADKNEKGKNVDKSKLSVDEQLKATNDAAARLVADADARAKIAETRAAEATAKLDAETKRADKAEGDLDGANREIVTLKEKLDAADTTDTEELQSQIDALKANVATEKDRADSVDEKFDERVRRRADIVRNAAMILGAKAVTKDAKDRELMVATIEQHDHVKLDEKKSDAYVEALFDRICTQYTSTTDGHAKLREAARATKRETEREDQSRESPRDTYAESQRDRASKAQHAALKRKGMVS